MIDLYMQLALNEAWKYQFLTYPNPAVACLILDKNGKILSLKAHKKAGFAHAELLAIKSALFALNPNLKFPDEPNLLHEFILKNHANLLKDASAYVTLEPCAHYGKTPPCAKLLAFLGFKKVFISVVDENEIASGGAKLLHEAGVEIKFGVLEKKGRELLLPFLKWQSGVFKLFKLALSMNGSALGKIVSNEKSRTHAHKIRSVIDALVVGGASVRADRPILDARLCEGRAPDVCILSRKKLDEFDKNIPLFSVGGRKIHTQIPQNAKFLMYEGGERFLTEFGEQMDMFLIYQNSKLNGFESVKNEFNFRPLWRGEFDDDSYGIFELA